MKEHTLLIVERRRRGRPVGTKVAEPGSPVTAWVPISLHDKAISVATAREISLSQFVKEAIIIAIRSKPSA